MAETKLVRIKPKGQVTLPADMRRALGLKDGDVVSIRRTSDGLLISSQEEVVMRALDRLGANLKQRGLTLDEWIEAAREERGKLVQELYGLASDE